MLGRRLVALTSVLVAVGLAGCAAFDFLKPRVDRVDVKIDGVDLAGVDLGIDVDLASPVSLTGTAPTLGYRLSIEGEQLAAGEGIRTQADAARGIVSSSVPLRVEYADIVRILGGLGSASEIRYELAGNVEVLGGEVAGAPVSIPFSTTGALPVVRVPSISVVRVDSPQFELSGDASVDVRVKVTNPNAFGFGLTQLGYGLELGGVRLAGLTATSNATVDAGATKGASLRGVIASADVLGRLFRGGSLDGVRVVPTGRLETPYGPIHLGGE